MDRRSLRSFETSFSIDLHPYHSGNALVGVQEQLNAWLLRWNHELGGVMLSYTEPALRSSQARIHPYFPYFHVDVSAKVHLFSPAPGHTITGQVNKIGADYIGLLVLGIFNAAIGRQNIRPDFRHSPLDNSWVSKKDARHRIEEGTEVLFTVHTVQNEGEFFSLTGKLDASWTGSVGHVSAAPKEEHRKKKKRKADAAGLGSEPEQNALAKQAPNSLTAQGKGVLSGQASRAADAPASTPGQAPPVLDSGVEKPKKKRQKQDASQKAQTGSLPPFKEEPDTGAHSTSHEKMTAKHSVPNGTALPSGLQQQTGEPPVQKERGKDRKPRDPGSDNKPSVHAVIAAPDHNSGRLDGADSSHAAKPGVNGPAPSSKEKKRKHKEKAIKKEG